MNGDCPAPQGGEQDLRCPKDDGTISGSSEMVGRGFEYSFFVFERVDFFVIINLYEFLLIMKV